MGAKKTENNIKNVSSKSKGPNNDRKAQDVLNAFSNTYGASSDVHLKIFSPSLKPKDTKKGRFSVDGLKNAASMFFRKGGNVSTAKSQPEAKHSSKPSTAKKPKPE